MYMATRRMAEVVERVAQQDARAGLGRLHSSPSRPPPKHTLTQRSTSALGISGKLISASSSALPSGRPNEDGPRPSESS